MTKESLMNIIRFVGCIIIFYGTPYLASKLLPKYWDMIVGFPLMLILLYYFILNTISKDND